MKAHPDIVLAANEDKNDNIKSSSLFMKSPPKVTASYRLLIPLMVSASSPRKKCLIYRLVCVMIDSAI